MILSKKSGKSKILANTPTLQSITKCDYTFALLLYLECNKNKIKSLKTFVRVYLHCIIGTHARPQVFYNTNRLTVFFLNHYLMSRSNCSAPIYPGHRGYHIFCLLQSFYHIFSPCHFSPLPPYCPLASINYFNTLRTL